MLIYSGNEIGPFRAIEESTLAQLTPVAKRGDIYAWYSLIGTAGTASGMMVSGWMIRYMRKELGWETLKVYRAIFWGYAAFGIIKVILILALSKAVEAEKKAASTPDPEIAPLLPDATMDRAPKKTFRSLLPDISAESKVIVFNLCLLFALDAFASGLAPL
jgi:MFS family permease